MSKNQFSTNDKATKFTKHGTINFDFSPTPPVLSCFVEGPFNKETLEAFSSIFFEDCVHSIEEVRRPYVEVIYCSGSCMVTNDAFDLHLSFLQKRRSLHLEPSETIVVLLELEESTEMLEQLWLPQFDSVKDKVTIFKSKETANEYLHSRY